MIAAARSDTPGRSQAEAKLARFIRFAGEVLKFSFLFICEMVFLNNLGPQQYQIHDLLKILK